MSAILLRADAGRIPLGDETVDLVVTSPPYFGQRSYRDAGEHYDGQLGGEPTPQAFLEALWAVTAECWRVLKPEGSMFVNLGDKRSGSGAPGTTSGFSGRRPTGTPIPGQVQGERSQISGGYNKAAFGRAKSRQMLPHRYAIGCEDGLADPDGTGWIMRQEIVWAKPNGMPESVRDRTRDSHEYWFHLTKQGRYFSSIDYIREPHTGGAHDAGPNAAATNQSGLGERHRSFRCQPESFNPLGRAPGSVWTIATQPLTVPAELEVEHFAAFPMEWPRRIVLGWSPTGICTACAEGRSPVKSIESEQYRNGSASGRIKKRDINDDEEVRGWSAPGYPQTRNVVTITGESCACPDTTAPTRPAVVLDPFGGTGTTALVADTLGRTGISIDLSADYLRLARWRTTDPGQIAKARGDKPPKKPPAPSGLPTLFDEATA